MLTASRASWSFTRKATANLPYPSAVYLSMAATYTGVGNVPAALCTRTSWYAWQAAHGKHTIAAVESQHVPLICS